MKNRLFATALFLLFSGNALAGTEYDKCIKEEKNLKAQETHDCNGLSYLLNPNACFTSQKALKEYASGKCKKIGSAENVDFSVQKTVPENKPGNATRGRSVANVNSAAIKNTKSEIPLPQTTIEQLQQENFNLKAEISRLKAENEQLKKTGR